MNHPASMCLSRVHPAINKDGFLRFFKTKISDR